MGLAFASVIGVMSIVPSAMSSCIAGIEETRPALDMYAAAEAAVGLAILLSLYRNRETVDMERFNLLRW